MGDRRASELSAAIAAIITSLVGSAAVVGAELIASAWLEADLPEHSYGPPGFAEQFSRDLPDGPV